MIQQKSLLFAIFISLSFSSFAQTLNIASVRNADIMRMKELSEHFTANRTDITLKWHLFDESELRKVVHSDLQREKPVYDIVTVGTYETPIYGKSGWLEPMSNLPKTYNLDDIFSSVRAGLSYKGTLFALPLYAESSVTMYRQDLFTRHDLHMSNSPTWEEIKHAASVLHNPENGTYGICLRGEAGWGNNIALISTIANSYGGQWFDMDWKPMINSSAWEMALSLYTELLTKYGPPDAHLNGYAENLELMKQGRCAIWVDSTAAGQHVVNAKETPFADNIFFAPPPHQVTPKGSGWLWSWALAVTGKSDNKEAAKQFALWASSQEYEESVIKHYGINATLPGARKSTYYNPEYLAIAPFALGTLEQLTLANPYDSTLHQNPYTGIQYVSIPHFREFGDKIGELFSEVLQGKLSVEDALKQAQQIISSKIGRAESQKLTVNVSTKYFSQ